MEKLGVYVFIIILSLFPLGEIFTTPNLPHTSDGAMHVTRFASYYKEFIAGQFPVRWASQYNYGYGMPLFNFFHPLPYLVSLPFTALGTPLVLTLKLSFLLTYVMAGIGMYLAAKAIFKHERIALLITVLYQFAPFRLVEMLVRGSLGSLYAYAVLPFVFFAITRFVQQKSATHFLAVSMSIALLVMSHNVVGFAFLVLTLLYIAILSDTIQTKCTLFIAALWGMGLTSFYLVPAVIEQKYTYAYLLTKNLFWDHFSPFFTFFIPNIFNTASLRTAEVSVQIGIFHVLTLGLLLSALIIGRIERTQRNLGIFLIVSTIVTVAFMQPITKPLWEHIAFLRQFQFPWRLLSVITFTSSLSAFVFAKTKLIAHRYWYFGFIIMTVMSTIYYWTPYQGYQVVTQEYFWNYPKSTNYFGEINSIWMAGEPLNFPKERIELISGKASISHIVLDPTSHRFSTDAKTQATFVDNTQFYPGWKVRLDNKELPIEFQNQLYRGLITFTVPTGLHEISITFEGNKLHKMANAASIFLLILLIIFWGIIKKYPHYEKIFFPRK